ncbi:MAG: DUF402 domain-containing protein [Dehalococcoidia bacterium]|nr:DUF402 domain-containing protein [Dehalococcoidia bacterium]
MSVPDAPAGYSPGDAPASLPRYREVKVKPGGAELAYETDLVHRDRTLVIVRFLMRQGGGPPSLPVEVPAGSVSYGYFWARRPYNVYRWLRADGTLIAHRFDAVTEVRIAGDSVRYRDLALDWWALPRRHPPRRRPRRARRARRLGRPQRHRCRTRERSRPPGLQPLPPHHR